MREGLMIDEFFDNNFNIASINALDERTVIGVNSKIMRITVDGDGSTYRGFCKDPYFKIYDGKDFDNSKNKTRISIYRPEYIVHNRDIWVLNSAELNELINIVCFGKAEGGMSIWDFIKYEACAESRQYKDYTEEIEEIIWNSKVPDYSKLHFSEKDSRKYGSTINNFKKKK